MEITVYWCFYDGFPLKILALLLKQNPHRFTHGFDSDIDLIFNTKNIVLILVQVQIYTKRGSFVTN